MEWEALLTPFSSFSIGLAPEPIMLVLFCILSFCFSFILPWIIAYIPFAMTFFIMAEDTSIDAWDAVQKSWKMMKGYKFNFFVLNLIEKILERCQSGRSGLPAKELCLYGYRGFESLPLRMIIIILFKKIVLLQTFSGYSVARSSRLLWEQEVAGSNPATPTKNGPRDVAQPGSAHAWGAWGRRFKSCHPD